ncbi:sulfotransferase family 2 domain-containing protein [Roseovarius aestuariivivens]|uniref:sulfotransferase family 2 domain-containing protein n=1 Tax=Roseovarius aestuariivivens TaxID=1888910 RepID=UPI001080E518|nr:sulfotransferase family 2 domain-containing protein [Roseovarius aestuariivivens]
MSQPFDYFVVFAEMRTGSNFLEANINAFDGFECYGEAFNPHFIGYPNRTEIAGISQATRDAHPASLIAAIKEKTDGLGGFRFFNDHDPRVLDLAMDDPRCAKIILTRNPVDSYVSWKIAQATGQWKLTNVKRRKDARARFDPVDFERHVSRLQSFQVELLNRLQKSGQTAFYIAYEDLQDLDVINGLARFLGSDERLERLDGTLKRQNPSPLSDKVENFDEMAQALSGLDPFNLSRTPNFEPRRNAAAPSFVAASAAPLLYMPIRSGPETEVLAWMAALDRVKVGDLPTGMKQKALRQWKRRHPGHRSFTVLRHPVSRAHAAFCDKILHTGPGGYADIRKTLRNFHKLPLPGQFPDPAYDLAAHRTAFKAFLDFLRANLAAQTAIRIDPHWASQSNIVQGMANFMPPDLILREDEMAIGLPNLARTVGAPDVAVPAVKDGAAPFALADIYDDEIEELAQKAYQRDYLMFGFAAFTA